MDPFRSGDRITKTEDADGLLLLRRDVSRDEVEDWLRADPAILIHKSRRTAVEKLETERGPICRKRYFLSSLRRRLTHTFKKPGRNSWAVAWGLIERDIRTAPPLAYHESSGLALTNEAVIFTEWIEGRQLHLYGKDHFGNGDLSPGEVREKRRFFADHARFVAAFQTAGVRHRDLAAQNTLVSKGEAGYEFALLDLDTVSFGRLSEKLLLRNLVHLADLPPFASTTDCWRWLRTYLEAGGAELWDETLKREGARGIVRRVARGVADRMARKRKRMERRRRKGNLQRPDHDPGAET